MIPGTQLGKNHPLSLGARTPGPASQVRFLLLQGFYPLTLLVEFSPHSKSRISRVCVPLVWVQAHSPSERVSESSLS